MGKLLYLIVSIYSVVVIILILFLVFKKMFFGKLISLYVLGGRGFFWKCLVRSLRLKMWGKVLGMFCFDRKNVII